MMDGVQGEFKSVGDAELVEDIVQMVLYGLLADEEFFSNFFIEEALSDMLHYFLSRSVRRALSLRSPDSDDWENAFMTSAVMRLSSQISPA